MTKKTETPQDIKEKIVLAALSQASLLGWDGTTLYDIAQEVEMDLATMHDHFEDKFDILAGIGRMIDRKVLEGLGAIDPEMSVREKLFDILMDRFEILNDHREGITAIVSSFKFDPKQALMSAPHLCRSMCWMMESAGESTHGIRGAIKLAGFTGLYLKVLRVWMKDDSPDLSKTMAALDKELGRAESMANSFGL